MESAIIAILKDSAIRQRSEIELDVQLRQRVEPGACHYERGDGGAMRL